MAIPLSETDVYCEAFGLFQEEFYGSSRILRKHKLCVEYQPDPQQRLHRKREDWAEEDDDLDIPEDEFRDIASPEGISWSEVRLDQLSLPRRTKVMSEETGKTQPPVVAISAQHQAKPNKGSKRKRGKESEQRRQKQRRAPPPGLTAAQAKFDDVVRGLKLRTTYFKARHFSLDTHARVTSTGWHGLPPPKNHLQSIVNRYRSGSIIKELANFHLIPFDLTSKSATGLIDDMDRPFAVRTTPAEFLAKLQNELYEAMYGLMQTSLSKASVKKNCELHNPRGNHFQCLMGHQRPYHDTIIFVKWHKDHEEGVEEFIRKPCVQELIAWINWVLRAFFPEVAARYEKCAKWHQEKYGVSPLFGLFWNFCINGIFPDQVRIHTDPHADPKNVVGICVIFVYVVPGSNFNHKVRSWFVIWEAGVIIEIPPWVAFYYPSSLFIHFNCDISDVQIIHTVDGSHPARNPTHTAKQKGFIGPDLPEEAHGRGSIVFFSQGNLFSSSETGFPTLGAARRAGYAGTTDIPGNFMRYYAPYGTFVPEART